jgi:hypothetical protein
MHDYKSAIDKAGGKQFKNFGAVITIDFILDKNNIAYGVNIQYAAFKWASSREFVRSLAAAFGLPQTGWEIDQNGGYLRCRGFSIGSNIEANEISIVANDPTKAPKTP